MKKFFSLCTLSLLSCFSLTTASVYASCSPSEVVLEMNTSLGKVTVYRPSYEELYKSAPTAKAIFVEAFSTTYTEYHRQSGSIASIEQWLRLKERMTLESWLSAVFDEEYNECFNGTKCFLYLCNEEGLLIGWLSYSPLSEKKELYLSQFSLEANSRNHKVTTTAFAEVFFKKNLIKQLFPGVKEVKLIARKINAIAHRLYTNAGFIVDETIDPAIYGDSYDDRYIGFRLLIDE